MTDQASIDRAIMFVDLARSRLESAGVSAFPDVQIRGAKAHLVDALEELEEGETE